MVRSFVLRVLPPGGLSGHQVPRSSADPNQTADPQDDALAWQRVATADPTNVRGVVITAANHDYVATAARQGVAKVSASSLSSSARWTWSASSRAARA